MKPLIIYHKNCLDGFGAAFAFWYHQEDAFEYFAANYEDTPPDVTDRQVYLLDFSYKRNVVKEMLSKASSIVFLDHHQTAIDDLAGLCLEEGCGNFMDVSNNSRSGAALAWIFASPTKDDSNMPEVLKAIEDYDLWKFNLPNTKEIIAYLYSQPFDFEKWCDICFEGLSQKTILKGELILELRQKQINDIVSLAVKDSVYHNDNDYEVMIVNCPRWIRSEVGNILAENNLFSVTYFDNSTHRTYSLRSIKDKTGGFDVSLIAKDLGGGGHRNAAGFTIPIHSNLYRSLNISQNA